MEIDSVTRGEITSMLASSVADYERRAREALADGDVERAAYEARGAAGQRRVAITYVFGPELR